MKRMTMAVLCLSLGSSILFAAPKPLLNPFAETINPTTATTQMPTPTITVQQPRMTPSSMQMQPMTVQQSPSGSYSNAPLPTAAAVQAMQPVMTKTSTTRIVVKGQGVAPSFTQSPAQAFALAKRAAMVDAYRLLGEKIQGVKVEGQDLIKNMMVKRSQVRTEVNAMIREAAVVETNFKDGLCEVEVELILSGAQWHNTLSHSFSE